MLRTHRYGNEGNLSRQDHLQDHVGEATPKRKGQRKTPAQNSTVYTRCRVCAHYSSAQSDVLLIVKLLSDFVVDVNGDRYS